MKKYELFQNLKEGQKITIVSSNDFGFIYVIQTVYQSSRPHEHYVNCSESMVGVEILHTPKKKRSLYTTVIDYNVPLLVYDGWLDIKTDCLYKTEEKNGTTITTSKYLSFDKRNFEEIKKHYSSGIIIEDIDC